MKLVLLSLFLSFAVATTSSPPPPAYTVTCTLGGDPCPTGSICTQTETCGGLCLASQTFPAVIPCTMGNNKPCGSASTCTPTMVCPPTPTECLGQCIATAPPTAQPPPPSVACIVSGDPCPQGSFCSQTMVCGGLCIPTPTPIPSPSPTVIHCGGHHRRHCPAGFKCVRQHREDRYRICVRKQHEDDCDDPEDDTRA
ncbi:uncharacterized protein V1513DRAFT_455667, partial [Lipomyces chichibuensis]|uniref:uncharacterized protein n=1 Tax=Lipomyces chichibuensis TaxID=1546026 RepID=UPI003344048B